MRIVASGTVQAGRAFSNPLCSNHANAKPTGRQLNGFREANCKPCAARCEPTNHDGTAWVLVRCFWIFLPIILLKKRRKSWLGSRKEDRSLLFWHPSGGLSAASTIGLGPQVVVSKNTSLICAFLVLIGRLQFS